MDRGNLLLVHGAWHGAWCWDRLVPELEARGWATSVVDLPGIGMYDDARAVREALVDLDGPVTVLAHSYAGVPVAEVAATVHSVTGLVYLAAHMLEPGESVVSALGGPWYPEGTELLDVPEPARDLLFADLPDELAAWAVERLRPQNAAVFEQEQTEAAWRKLPTAAILCEDDRIFPAMFTERAARAEVVRYLPGGHSPFLSRPRELAELICELA
ncbi:alpha/beta fold hydrolase [Lentzea indica]|nr:alpha/beta hydrolase [Lentzea indica]